MAHGPHSPQQGRPLQGATHNCHGRARDAVEDPRRAEKNDR